MKQLHSRALAALITVALGAASVSAQAGVMDFLFGKKASTSESGNATVNPNKKTWRLSEFTAVQIVPREAGSAPNAHPARLNPEGVRQQLVLVQAKVDGKSFPLFYGEEIQDLVEPITQALSVAGPNEDLVLLSTHRRGESVLTAPLGITARLFVQDGNLNVIVHDARRDFVDAYIGTKIPPTFEFGERAKQSKAVVQSTSAATKRTDWIAIPIAAAVPAPVVPAAMTAPTAAPIQQAAPAGTVTTLPAPAPAPAAVLPAATPTRDTAYYEEQARRLKGLKLLRDQGAITEEEYQQKRKEILSGL
ncbi:SHOCT domain-containing protein [Piscinibacter terrae]|uniref:SHOCT domain-containing protein n=1 Tax=Piscinibacter terrae TaxID=2496871 RepID=A0A3N7HMP5_9BURK|nr:SHOCT domain-containing protein [Albitalea terrae]RQP22873.1 SHOCT domain-containing protein [Albitalea terrae]